MKNCSFEIIYDFNVNLLHFIDSLSQWSPYCGDSALAFFKSNFKINEEDEKKLREFKNIRIKLGWENETNLFLWAHENFTYKSFFKLFMFEFSEENEKRFLSDKDKRTMFESLKCIINYFQEREKKKIFLIDILKDRYSIMLNQIESIRSEIRLAHKEILKISKLLNIFTDCLDFKEYPVFICFAFSNFSLNGGANGKGIYAEFSLIEHDEKMRQGVGLIIHEMLHKIVNMKFFLREFMRMNSCKFGDFYSDILRIMDEKDPKGFNREIDVFEEIIIYMFSDVYIANFSIEKKMRVYKSEPELREFYRIWYGVNIFKRMFDEYFDKEIDNTYFIVELLRTFYEKIYYKNFDLRGKCS